MVFFNSFYNNLDLRKSRKIEKIKSSFKKEQALKVNISDENSIKIIANSFEINIKKVLDFKDKTAFVAYNNSTGNFDIKKFEIYTQCRKFDKKFKV